MFPHKFLLNPAIRYRSFWSGPLITVPASRFFSHLLAEPAWIQMRLNCGHAFETCVKASRKPTIIAWFRLSAPAPSGILRSVERLRTGLKDPCPLSALAEI